MAGTPALAREWQHRHVAMYQMWSDRGAGVHSLHTESALAKIEDSTCMRGRGFRRHRLVAAFGSCAADHALTAFVTVRVVLVSKVRVYRLIQIYFQKKRFQKVSNVATHKEVRNW